jgi:hypothetical protein
VVAELVRARHSHVPELKESLREEGQENPGVITRSGVLINANTRCVLMRELLVDGTLRENAIRVAVLPEDITAAELYDLEAVLQKQRDYKDDYDLVSELMMIRTLHEEGGMSAARIAKRQRISAAGVTLRFKVLSLMERARLLTSPPLPIKEFGGEKTQLQNWKELVTRIEKLDEECGRESGDNHLREYIELHLLGMGAVHTLRAATPGWVDGHLVGTLPRAGSVGKRIAAVAEQGEQPTTLANAPIEANGLDLLDFGTNGDTGSQSVRAVLDLTVKALAAGTGDVQLPDGTSMPGPDVVEALKTSTKAALKSSKMQLDAGERLEKPARLFESARNSLEQANLALADVIDDPDFAVSLPEIESLVEDLTTAIDEARESLERADQL